jgi:1-aminocyclopropane-1-carboxylate deaminase
VQDVLSKGKNKIVTYGGAYSNHLVATAFAGHHFGIETHAFLRGDEPRPNNAFENTCISYGMKLHKVSRTDYRKKTELFETHFGNDPLAEMIGEGGRHPMAVKGCAEILNELEYTYDDIVLSVGTGTTMYGILNGMKEQNIPGRVIGISSLKNNYELDEIMSVYPAHSYVIEHGYHRGKYAENDLHLSDFIRQFKSETDINLEFVYTGKMMMALADLIKTGRIEKGRRILCIHTGGLPQLLDQ